MLDYSYATSYFSRLHKWSTRLRFGLFSGHYSTGIWLSWNHFLHTLPTCILLKYNCFITLEKFSGGGGELELGLKYFIYSPLITQILPILFDVIQSFIITLTGYFAVCVMKLGCKSSSILFLWYFMPSLPNTERFWSHQTWKCQNLTRIRNI